MYVVKSENKFCAPATLVLIKESRTFTFVKSAIHLSCQHTAQQNVYMYCNIWYLRDFKCKHIFAIAAMFDPFLARNTDL